MKNLTPMKILNYLFYVLLVSQSITSYASENFQSERKVLHQAKLSPGAYIELSNQYGDIEITPSKNDSVKIWVDITVNSKKQDNLDAMLNGILIDFKATKSYVLAKTTWSGEVNFFQKSYHTVKSGVINGSENIIVNYKVQLPSTTELILDNKFGNIYMDSHSGRLVVKLSHGDFRARDLPNLKSAEIKYGKFKVNKIGDTRIDFTAVKYAEINEAKNIILNSTSSDIEIAIVDQVELNSKHDEIQIEQIKKLTGTSSLSDIKINKLKNILRLDSKLGSIRVKNIEKNAKYFIRTQGFVY